VDFIGLAFDVFLSQSEDLTRGEISIFFSALATALYKSPSPKADSSVMVKALEVCLFLWYGMPAQHTADQLTDIQQALNALYTYTRARPPSRTLVDPLAAFVTTLSLDPSDTAGAVTAAREAAEATSLLDAKVGRAAYVNREDLREHQVPDAGAWGVNTLIEGVWSVLGQAPRE
jgi:hypothetical protein